MNNQTTTNARDTYHAYANDIAHLIDVLEIELQKHAETAKTDSKNWSKVGDLGKVRNDLIEVVGYISGMDRLAIENFLAE